MLTICASGPFSFDDLFATWKETWGLLQTLADSGVALRFLRCLSLHVWFDELGAFMASQHVCAAGPFPVHVFEIRHPNHSFEQPRCRSLSVTSAFSLLLLHDGY